MNGDINRSVGTSVVCYFCSETIQSPYLLQIHVKQCGSMLEKCPNKCGSWVERKNRSSHLRQCSKKVNTGDYSPRDGSSTLPSRSSMGQAIYQVFEERAKDERLTENVNSLKMEVENLKYVLFEEKKHKDSLIDEVEKLRRQYNLSEERNQIAMATLTALRRYTDEELNKQRVLMSDINNELNHTNLKKQEFREFILQTELRINNIEKALDFERNERSHLELIVNAQDGKLRFMNKIEEDMDMIKNDKSQTDLTRNDKILNIQNELRELKTLLAHESLQHKQQLHNVQLLQDEYARSSADLKGKHETIEYDLKLLKSTENEDKINMDMMQKSLESLTKTIHQMRDEEKKVKLVNENLHQPFVATGRLIWRIDNYHEKMKDSISNGIIYQSTIFMSDAYGYTLQAELLLNGIGKWHGRHLIVTVFIVSGEYDPILDWPAYLQADVIIKDQTPKKSQAQDIVKTLIVKKRENDDSNRILEDTSKKTDPKTHEVKRQYIFVPHTSLDKLDFIKNNTMFIEILISKP